MPVCLKHQRELDSALVGDMEEKPGNTSAKQSPDESGHLIIVHIVWAGDRAGGGAPPTCGCGCSADAQKQIS